MITHYIVIAEYVPEHSTALGKALRPRYGSML
jgi:hypothetical protein